MGTIEQVRKRGSAAFRFLQAGEEDGVATLTLNRPPLNILNIEMMEELDAALGGLKARLDLRVLLLRGSERAFSAGVDVADHTQDRAGAMLRAFHGLFIQLAGFEVPTVAVVDGVALGGGCELATFCDFVIATDRSRFGQPEVNVGVFPPVAALTFPRLVGSRRALELLLTGVSISGEEAREIGLINQAVPAERLESVVSELVERLRDKSAAVLALTKRAMAMGGEERFRAELERVESLYLEGLLATYDAHEGLQAFLEKRPPRWRHQ